MESTQKTTKIVDEIVIKKGKVRRFVQNGDVRVEVRVFTPSKDTVKFVKKDGKQTTYNSIAINPKSIEREYAKQKGDLLRSIATLSPEDRKEILSQPIDFVENKEEQGFKKYQVHCKSCGSIIADVWAKDDTLIDWCDLHYMSEVDQYTWRGCVAVNVSPIDSSLGFECACGEDTRDFRSNTNLPPLMRRLMIEHTEFRRGFGHEKASFLAEEIKHA